MSLASEMAKLLECASPLALWLQESRLLAIRHMKIFLKDFGARAVNHPKARLFMILSVLWFFPSLGAAAILVMSRGAWRNVTSLPEFLAATRLEQWVALALLLAHLVFIVLAIQKSGKQIPGDAV